MIGDLVWQEKLCTIQGIVNMASGNGYLRFAGLRPVDIR